MDLFADMLYKSVRLLVGIGSADVRFCDYFIQFRLEKSVVFQSVCME